MDLTRRRIVVTGGAGFLGSYVVRELVARGVPAASVFVPRSRAYDLTRREAVARLYQDALPDVVIHLAARVGGIAANRAQPGRFFYDNLIMGVELLEEARLRGLEKFVTVGTVCSYPKLAPIPFREEDLFAGYPEETNAPYGIAKRALLVQCQAYREQYGLNAVFLIPTNLYGPGDDFDPSTSHVIPALIRKCVEARLAGRDRIVCWGDGSATRDFLYVEDAARAVVLAAERYDAVEPVNLGSGDEVSIRNLAHTIVKLTGFGGAVEWDAAMPNGQPRRCLDVSRAASRLGWRACTPFEQGVKLAVRWLRRRLAPPAPDPSRARAAPVGANGGR